MVLNLPCDKPRLPFPLCCIEETRPVLLGCPCTTLHPPLRSLVLSPQLREHNLSPQAVRFALQMAEDDGIEIDSFLLAKVMCMGLECVCL